MKYIILSRGELLELLKDINPPIANLHAIPWSFSGESPARMDVAEYLLLGINRDTIDRWKVEKKTS